MELGGLSDCFKSNCTQHLKLNMSIEEIKSRIMSNLWHSWRAFRSLISEYHDHSRLDVSALERRIKVVHT